MTGNLIVKHPSVWETTPWVKCCLPCKHEEPLSSAPRTMSIYCCLVVVCFVVVFINVSCEAWTWFLILAWQALRWLTHFPSPKKLALWVPFISKAWHGYQLCVYYLKSCGFPWVHPKSRGVSWPTLISPEVCLCHKAPQLKHIPSRFGGRDGGSGLKKRFSGTLGLS